MMTGFARGRVWKQGRTWFYEVSVAGRVVFADNTGHWAPVLRACNNDVLVADRVVNSGHGFQKTYPELVEETHRHG